MDFTISISGEKQISRSIRRWSEHMDDARPVFRDLMKTFRGRAKKQFSSQGSSGSGGWKPLKASTIAAKKRAGLDKKILHATHKLRTSMIAQSSTMGIRIILPGSMGYGSSLKYAPHHQYGTKFMPRRRVLEFRESERRADLKTIQRFIVTGRVS